MIPLRAIISFVGFIYFTSCGVLARPASTAVWAADSIIARGQGHGLDSSNRPTVSYEHGEFQWALRLLYEHTGNETYFNYIQSGIDNIVTSNGTVLNYAYVQIAFDLFVSTPRLGLITSLLSISDFTLDPVRVGPTFIYL